MGIMVYSLFMGHAGFISSTVGPVIPAPEALNRKKGHGSEYPALTYLEVPKPETLGPYVPWICLEHRAGPIFEGVSNNKHLGPKVRCEAVLCFTA